jgi:murein DD-endopeptidase MepM/ murein hydrolase activator NlpD
MFISLRKKAISLIIFILLPIKLSGFYLINHDQPILESEEVIVTGEIVIDSDSKAAPINKPDYNRVADMVWPVENPVISSGWGHRDSCRACSDYHRGLDFVPGRGEPVLAVMGGTISKIEYSGGYGVHIIIDHNIYGNKWQTLYAHMQKDSIPANLKVGSSVEMGEQIGKVGNTGISTGPHLHFEMRVDEIRINPLPLLEKNVIENTIGV